MNQRVALAARHRISQCDLRTLKNRSHTIDWGGWAPPFGHIVLTGGWEMVLEKIFGKSKKQKAKEAEEKRETASLLYIFVPVAAGTRSPCFPLILSAVRAEKRSPRACEGGGLRTGGERLGGREGGFVWL
eukprot:COSAG02_NODE_2773_length_8058_cov_8.208820_1_plen_130_part_00